MYSLYIWTVQHNQDSISTILGLPTLANNFFFASTLIGGSETWIESRLWKSVLRQFPIPSNSLSRFPMQEDKWMTFGIPAGVSAQPWHHTDQGLHLILPNCPVSSWENPLELLILSFLFWKTSWGQWCLCTVLLRAVNAVWGVSHIEGTESVVPPALKTYP